ncbi:MAG: hypothetical protein KKE50_06595 [Nanoarchaeota archaeon]|nr:hypothetical protein [Nanoarchaeota archaeon]
MIAGFSWIILGVLLVVFLVLLKVRHVKHRFFALILVLLMIFLYFTSSSILANKAIDFKSFEGWVTAGKIYFSWLIHAFDNTKSLLGNAIKMDWAGNSTGG